MRKKGNRWFVYVLAAVLGAGTLAGCGSSGKASTSEGLMGGFGAPSVSSAAENVSDTDEGPSDDQIGRYVTQGYENPAFGFRVSLPDTFTLKSRDSVIQDDSDTVDHSNQESVYDWVRTMTGLINNAPIIFQAESENTLISISIQSASSASFEENSGWASEEEILENSKDQLEDEIKKNYEGEEVSDFQSEVSDVTLADQKHASLRYTCSVGGSPFYGTDIVMISDDDEYLLSIDINGYDYDEINDAGAFFTAYDGSANNSEVSVFTAEETAPENVTGTQDGTTYTNDFFGVTCTLENENWVVAGESELRESDGHPGETYTPEEMTEALRGGDVFTDFSATISADTDYEYIATTLEYSGEITSLEDEIDTIINDGDLQTQLENSGISDVTLWRTTGTFLGETVPMLAFSGTNQNDVLLNGREAYLLKDGYALVASAITAYNDHSEELLGFFQKIS